MPGGPGGFRPPPPAYTPPPGHFQGPVPAGKHDGPNDNRGRNPFGQGMGFDPAKPPVKQSIITNTRMELPAAAYALEKPGYPSDLPMRPGTNTKGKAIQIRVNQFKVTQWPDKDLFQYDINISNGAEKRGLIKKVWESDQVQSKIKQFTGGMPMLWDGNKLAWSLFDIQELRISVNMDQANGRPQRPTGPEIVYAIIRRSKMIRMAVIGAYLSKQIPFDDSILECINFLDHAIRMWPSTQYTAIKRSFFSRGVTRNPLDNVVEAMRGVYSSIRLCNPQSSVGAPATGLALNVDVANGTFWVAQDLHQAARNLCHQRNKKLDYNVAAHLWAPVKYKSDSSAMSEDFKELRKMAKLKFFVKHRGGKETNKKEYQIKKFMYDKSPKYIGVGINAKNFSFEFTDRKLPEGHPKRSQMITIFDYFKKQYDFSLKHWNLPLVVTSRDGTFPMEVCELLPNQKYQYKLSAEQTAAMIKFAVTRPKARIEAINHGIQMLQWDKDPYLNAYGIKIDPNMTVTAARLLAPPEVQYTASKASPGTTGRWDLRGKKFYKSNPEPLKAWGMVVVGSCIDMGTAQNFLKVFVDTYIGHGGKVVTKQPIIYMQGKGEHEADAAQKARHQIGNKYQMIPQILFFVLPGRDSFMYERLKKNCECRFGLVTQMLNIAHVKKAAPQYCSNVCMKVNAKLGGTSCKAIDSKQPKSTFFPRPTMILGADVSHATPGSPQPSIAALTMSFDKECIRFAASVRTNGYRVEMITDSNLKAMIVPLFKRWVAQVGGGSGPQHIYYFRDGVSEGQFQHVLDQEIRDIKKALIEAFGQPAAAIKFTVTVCTKRHHIRFFPKAGDGAAADKNDNPLPGTLVERDVTHPFEYDFYLSAHSAIQGTARPVHYHVIMDEAKCNVDEFQRMIYQMSYQYMRSTTPVSLFPAVYYAHLASNRARAHESSPASDGPRGGQKYEELQQDQAVARVVNPSIGNGSSQTGTTAQPLEAPPLLPLGGSDVGPVVLETIRTGMWYI